MTNSWLLFTGMFHFNSKMHFPHVHVQLQKLQHWVFLLPEHLNSGVSNWNANQIYFFTVHLSLWREKTLRADIFLPQCTKRIWICWNSQRIWCIWGVAIMTLRILQSLSASPAATQMQNTWEKITHKQTNNKNSQINSSCTSAHESLSFPVAVKVICFAVPITQNKQTSGCWLEWWSTRNSK